MTPGAPAAAGAAEPAPGPVRLSPAVPSEAGNAVLQAPAVLPAPAPRPQPATPAPAPAEAERPALPRRRAQHHLAPQLRETPAPRRAPETEQPVHDPGLMAAFQRGFGLAQSEQQA